MSNDYTPDPARFLYAAMQARDRSLAHWDLGNWNMWLAYNTVLNQSWVDPWFEYEAKTTSNESPNWEMTQNLYYLYCWFKWKGYSDYAIVGAVGNMCHESTLSGGAWEGSTEDNTGQHPYSTLIGYDATSVNHNAPYYNYNWAIGGNPLDYASPLATWTKTWTTPAGVDYGSLTGHTWRKTADAGSWDAVKKYDIKTKRQMLDGVGPRILPVGYATDELQWDYDKPLVQGDGRGYGLVQWTAWTKLPALAVTFGNDAPRHWQLNATLQLMIIEHQRELSAQGQTGGEWNAVDAVNAGFMVNASGYYHSFGQSCTWENFANDSFIPWVEAECAADNITNPDDIDWAKRMTALTIWQNCYEHGGHNPTDYFNMGFPAISKYVLSAVQFWDGPLGLEWDVRYIPRARDIANCPLDQYHGTPLTQKVKLTSGRRGKHVTSIFL